VHVFEDRSIVSVLEVCPYSALRLASFYKVLRGRCFDCAARDAGEKASTEEDRKDAEILSGVGYGNSRMASAKGILETRAEVMREWHLSRMRGRMVEMAVELAREKP
jgi:hypothetical protein